MGILSAKSLLLPLSYSFFPLFLVFRSRFLRSAYYPLEGCVCLYYLDVSSGKTCLFFYHVLLDQGGVMCVRRVLSPAIQHGLLFLVVVTQIACFSYQELFHLQSCVLFNMVPLFALTVVNFFTLGHQSLLLNDSRKYF